jgi:hypothetical protein
MSMFGGNQPQQPDMVNPTPIQPPIQPKLASPMPELPAQVEESYDPVIDMQKLYQPRTSISNRYSQELANQPAIDPISWKRRIGAMMVAALVGKDNPANGVNIGSEIINQPNIQKQERWKQNIDALSRGAAEEDRYNTNQRILANDIVSRKQNQFKQDEVERKNKVDQERKEKETDIKERRAEAYIFKQHNPDWKVLMPKGGNITFYNPQNPQEMNDTGIPTGSATDMDRIEWQKDARIEEIGAQGAQTRTNQNNQGNVQSGLIKQRGEESRKTKTTIPGSTSDKDSESVVEVKDASGKVIGTRTTKTTKTREGMLHNKAAEFVKSIGLPVTDANIEHAIKTGRVK